MTLDVSNGNQDRGPLAFLRRFAQPRPTREQCDLCGAGLPDDHSHLVEPAARRLLCACEPCAILFRHSDGGKFHCVPRRVEALTDFRLTDVQWEGLGIPINLAFFLHSTPAGRVIAVYPSPGGATEALLPLDAWEELVAENPALRDLEPDVEALLVNRVGDVREHFRVGIDECYRLVGLLRMHWRGFSGGNAVWEEIGRFFDRLKQRSRPPGEPTHA